MKKGGDFIVTNGTPDSTQPPLKRSRRKKIARLAVDQHIALQQSESKGQFKQSIPTPEPTQQRREASPSLHHNGKSYECKVCKVKVGTEAEADKHVTGKKHYVQVMLHSLKKDK